MYDREENSQKFDYTKEIPYYLALKPAIEELSKTTKFEIKPTF